MELEFSQRQVDLGVAGKGLHPDTRFVTDVGIQTRHPLHEPSIAVRFSGSVLVVLVHGNELTRDCTTDSQSPEVMNIHFKGKAVPEGSLIRLTVQSASEVKVQSVEATGFSVH
jgi:hypothetical protein